MSVVFRAESKTADHSDWPPYSGNIWLPLASPQRATVLVTAARGLKVESKHPGIVQVMDVKAHPTAPDSLLVSLASLAAGSTEVQALDGRRVEARMFVDVFTPRLQWLNVFLAQDAGLKPTLSLAEVPLLVRQMCSYITPWTNIQFHTHRVEGVTLNADMASPDQTPQQLARIFWRLHELVRATGSTAQLNLFVVRTWGATNVTGGASYSGHTFGVPGSICVASESSWDASRSKGYVAAHEVCHALGAEHDEHKDSLLRTGFFAGGTKLYRDAALAMRSIAPRHRSFIPIIPGEYDPSANPDPARHLA